MHWRNTFFIFASQARIFWSLRAKLSYWIFLVHRQLFGVKGHVRENKILTSTFLQFIGIAIKPFFLSALFAAALLIIDLQLADFYKSYHIEISDEAYTLLLATVTSIGGILIGLYYAATTAIGGATYAHVPNEIRHLLAHERIGNVYMRFLAGLTFFGLVLIALQVVGFPPILIAVPIFIFAAGIAILVFVAMGIRAFDLFDPTTHSADLIEQTRRSYLRMTPAEYWWLDPPFQVHAHKQGRSYIDTIKSLTKITARENYSNGQPYANLCGGLVSFLIDYEATKKKIPTESRWYEKRYEYPDWYKTDDSTTSIIYQTSAKLPPKIISNRKWVEGEFIPIIYDCLRKNAQLGRTELVSALLSYFGKYIVELARQLEVQASFDALDDLVTQCNSIFFEPLPGDCEREPLERLSVADWLASVPIDILLTYLESTKNLGRERIVSTIAKMKWQKANEIYESGLPAHALPQLEWLLPHLQFEIASEGQKISPDWYNSELVLQSVCENAKLSTMALVDAARSLYDKWLNAASQNNLIWVRATIVSREIRVLAQT